MTQWIGDDQISFALFGLARQEALKPWVRIDWSRPVLHLGPGKKIIKNAIELEFPEFDFDDEDLEFPFDTNSVGGVVATHVLEHMADPTILMREVARVLHPGCPFDILVPHGQSIMFMQDIDHKTPFVLETWKTLLENAFYDNQYGAGSIPFEIGANFKFGIKEGNEAIITQLIKVG